MTEQPYYCIIISYYGILYICRIYGNNVYDHIISSMEITLLNHLTIVTTYHVDIY